MQATAGGADKQPSDTPGEGAGIRDTSTMKCNICLEHIAHRRPHVTACGHTYCKPVIWQNRFMP